MTPTPRPAEPREALAYVVHDLLTADFGGCDHRRETMQMWQCRRWSDAIRAESSAEAHYTGENGPQRDCHNLTHRELDDAKAEAARLRAALKDAVRIMAGGHKGYAGDHWLYTVQVNERTLNRLRAALRDDDAPTVRVHPSTMSAEALDAGADSELAPEEARGG